MKKANWTRLFWSSRDAPPPADELSEQEITELAAEAAQRGPSSEPPAAPIDDPQLAQVLVAFEAMKAAMPAPQLAIAIRATVKAIQADPAGVARSITQRLAAIDAAVADTHRTTSEREATRTTELATATAKVRAEIEEMERAIQTRRAQLAAVTEQLQRMTTDERTAAATFEAKARDEAARLVALRDVLGTK